MENRGEVINHGKEGLGVAEELVAKVGLVANSVNINPKQEELD